MKQILTIFFAALIFTACQSQSAKDEGSSTAPLTSESKSDIPTHNPAHGQPYHDCSIAVGAPLVVKESTGEAGVKKLNPAHGQPGHRCDIAVGAPLS
jgi:hypothetical protein